MGRLLGGFVRVREREREGDGCSSERETERLKERGRSWSPSSLLRERVLLCLCRPAL